MHKLQKIVATGICLSMCTGAAAFAFDVHAWAHQVIAAERNRESHAYIKAEQSYSRLLEDAKLAPKELQSTLVSTASDGLAQTYIDQGKLSAAEALCQEKLLWLAKRGDGRRIGAASLHCSLSRVYRLRLKYEDAQNELEAAIAIQKECGATQLVINSIALALPLYAQQNRLDRAELVLQESIDKDAMKALSPFQQAQCLNLLGRIRALAHKYKESEQLYLQALRLYDQSPSASRYKAQCLKRLAECRAHLAKDSP